MMPCSRAVLVVPGVSWSHDQVGPAELFHLGDRPFLHHVIESIVARGCERVDVLLGEWPEEVEAALGDGSRWGLRLVYHLSRDPSKPLARLGALDLSDAGESVLFALGSTLPARGSVGVEVAGHGWSVLAPKVLGQISSDCPVAELPVRIAELCDAPRAALDDAVTPKAVGRATSPAAEGPTLDARTSSGFLEAMSDLLDGRRTDLLTSGQEAKPGVRIAWNARVHPRAKVRGPVFLGEQAWVGPDAEVGPFAVVGAGAIVDAGAVVRGAAVEPGSYVGEGLTVERSVVRREWLMNDDLGASLELDDPLLLGAAEARVPTRPLGRAVERTVGLAVALATLPVALCTAAVLKVSREGPVLHRPRVLRNRWRRGASRPREEEVRLFTFDPTFGTSGLASRRPSRWKDLVLRILPGMWSVARGDLSLVGLEPRAPEVVRELPEAWRRLYRTTQSGLVTEAEVSGGAVDDETLFVFEAHFAARAGFVSRAKLMARYLTGARAA